MSVLDRPVWNSLTNLQRDIAEGDDLAVRYQRDINLWSAVRDDSDDAYERLLQLVAPGQSVMFAETARLRMPTCFDRVEESEGVQMVDSGDADADRDDPEIVPLGDCDAADMLKLATLTRPGPFLSHTHRMGGFFGIRMKGHLVAMAGERFKLPGYTEVSAVCVHPDARGYGLAARVSLRVMKEIRERGETPILHAWKSNTAAINLYRKLGFYHRSDIHTAVLSRDPH